MLVSFYLSAGSAKCITRVHWSVAPNKGDSVCINSKRYKVVMVEHNIDVERISVLMEAWGE